MIRIGCQSWGYDDWITQPAGDYIFYPPSTKRPDMLAFYSKVFDTIEIDATLYGIPPASTFEKWYRETPEGFIFSLKFPREITHDLRLASGSVPIMEEFVDRARLLKQKLGVMLIQFPASFDGSSENGQNLRGFLSQLPRDLKFAVEFRNQEWFIDRTFQELSRNAVTLGLVEGPWLPRETIFKAARHIETDFAYIRIMGERDLPKFDRIYRHRDDVLKQWVREIELLQARNVFIYVDNYFEGFAPATVAKLSNLLGRPVRHAEDFQEQGSLF